VRIQDDGRRRKLHEAVQIRPKPSHSDKRLAPRFRKTGHARLSLLWRPISEVKDSLVHEYRQRVEGCAPNQSDLACEFHRLVTDKLSNSEEKFNVVIWDVPYDPVRSIFGEFTAIKIAVLPILRRGWVHGYSPVRL
jgi:hypothetical protein